MGLRAICACMTQPAKQRRTGRRFTAMSSDPVTVAQRLLGKRLVRILDGVRLSGIIVEVEAYLGEPDLAAHTCGGHRSPRNEAMYLPGGHAYVYFTYGMHHCLNIVCGRRDEGVAVLVRALQPVEGIDQMRRRRVGARRDVDLCRGPGRLTQALGIDRRLDGESLRRSDRLFIEWDGGEVPPEKIVRTPRIGLSKSIDRVVEWGIEGRETNWFSAPLRLAIRENTFVSGPLRLNRIG